MTSWGQSRRDMAVVRNKLGCEHDVSEFYSPPRVVKMARELGMKGGVSLDLTVPASDGYVWEKPSEQLSDRAGKFNTPQRVETFITVLPRNGHARVLYRHDTPARFKRR